MVVLKSLLGRTLGDLADFFSPKNSAPKMVVILNTELKCYVGNMVCIGHLKSYHA